MDNNTSDKVQFPQVYIVEASAGSGKTYALAKRYIQLLINPYLKPEEIPLKNILAITFSNKAAIEMKERILEFLKKIALDKFSNEKEKEDILSSLKTDRAFAQKKAYMIMDYIIRNYNFFQVQTIDSFINAILSGCAFRISLSANFKIKTDYRDYLSYSLDKLVDKAAYNKGVLEIFNKFLTQYLIIENKTGWFPKKDIMRQMNLLFSINNQYKGEFTRANIEAEELRTLKIQTFKLMNDLYNNLPEGTNGKFQNSFSSFINANKALFDIRDLSSYFSNEGFPIKKNYQIPQNIDKLWGNIRKSLIRLAEGEAMSLFNYYIDIFNMISPDFRELSSREDVLFLEELNKQTRVLLDENSMTVPELYYRLATQFKHFLIDEFQDTSGLQWKNLELMAEEALSTGGSLFYVGDKKQAIYRFRGGDVSLIDSVKNKFRNFNVITGVLDKNYRSSKNIVEFNNKIFSEDNLGKFFSKIAEDNENLNPENINEIINIFKESKQEYKIRKEEGYIKIEFIDVENRYERDKIINDKLVELIYELKKRFEFRDIALLTRKNSEIELVTSWLLEKNIPIESEKTLNIRENSYIKEIISLLKFLNSPIDNLSFASFILGNIFLKVSNLKREKIQDFIFEARNKILSGETYLYREFQREFPGIWKTLMEEFFKNVGFVPLYELTISIYSRFNCLINFHEYQGFFMRFLEFIKEQEDERQDIPSFLEYFDNAPVEELYINVSKTNSVKALTIHKAKGLEFPVVILPFAEMDVKVDKEIIYPEDDMLRIMHINKKSREISPALKQIYNEAYKKSFMDELNNMYVAFTRPKDELYIFIPKKNERRSFNIVNILIPSENPESGCRVKPKLHSEREFLFDIPASEFRDWIKSLKDEFTNESFVQDKEKVLKGNIMHSILSFIGDLNEQDVNFAVKQAVEKTKFKYQFVDDFQEFEDVIKRLITDKKFHSIFYIDNGTVYSEKEIVDSIGNTKRLDRLIVLQSEVWIIDYKSSKDDGNNYDGQMKEYINIIKGMYPAKKIKGILIYLDNLSMEEVHG